MSKVSVAGFLCKTGRWRCRRCHHELISRMMKEMDVVIIGLGSIQESGTVNNPYTPKQKREMVEKVCLGT